MSGADYRIPLKALLQAHKAHQAGWSIRALGRLHYREWGYASPKSAAMALSTAFRALDLPARDRIEATVLASEIHGNGRRAFRDPAHPEHDRFLAQRRHTRAMKSQREET